MQVTKKETFQINKTKEQIRAFLSNMEDYGAYHPLITSAEPIDAERSLFIIKEKPFSWLPIRIKYKAKVQVLGRVIIYETFGIPLNKAILEFRTENEGLNHTTVNLKVVVKGPILISSFLASKILKAQKHLFNKLSFV